jgi:ABC-2 type transport system ATP-binding protein
MLKVSNLIYQVPQGDVVLDNINFEVKQGEFLGILGRNGAGKTTLLDLIMGFRPHTSGQILVHDEYPQSTDKLNAHEVAFLSQDLKLKQGTSVGKFLEFHSFFYPQYSKQKEKDLLNFFELDPKQKIGSLSTGQQKKTQIIAGIASQAKLILIDEITAVLDPETRLKFFVLLERIHSEGQSAIVLATNIVEDLNGRVDKILFIDRNKAEVLENYEINELFDLDLIVDQGEAA